MELDYHKVWNAMNELEQQFSKFSVVRDVLEVARDKSVDSDVENTIDASIELFDIYTAQWDEQYKNAWDTVVVPLHIREYSSSESREESRKDLDVLDDVINQAEKFYHTASHKLLTYQEAVDAGYSMTDDGFWVPPEKEEDLYVCEDGK